MSIQFCGRRAGDGGTSGSVSAVGNIESMVEQSSYQEAFQVDPVSLALEVLRLQHLFTCHFPDPAVNVQRTSISFDTAGSLFDMNQEVIPRILETKKDVWKTFGMFLLVDDYFENRIIDFFTALKKARDSQPMVELAKKILGEEYVVDVAADEEDQPPEGKRKTRYAKTLDELRQYFFVGGIGEFKSVHQQQLSLLWKLQNLEGEQDRELKSVRKWRNVTRIIFVSVFATLLICSVLAAIEAAPRIAAAMAAATAIPVGSIGKLFDSMWKGYQDTLKAEKELINKMHAGTSVVLTGLNSIKSLVYRLEDNIRSFLVDAEFVLENEDAVRPGIEEMRKKMEILMKIIESWCNRLISVAGS